MKRRYDPERYQRELDERCRKAVSAWSKPKTRPFRALPPQDEEYRLEQRRLTEGDELNDNADPGG